MDIILASASPRRKELLEQINIKFKIMVSNVDENCVFNGDISEYVKELAFQKANSIKNKVTGNFCIIGSDTVVFFENKILGKPKDKEDAFNMLKKLQNNKCIVSTGLCIIKVEKGNKKIYKDVSTCEVYLDEMTDEEIDEYINTGEPMDKAGAFAIQGIGGRYIKEIKGDYYAVVGLPINKVYKILRKI